MKIMHTADWHVGKTLRGRSRIAEHADALQEIVAIAAGENVDLVLIAGDLFDSAAPTPDAERVVYSTLVDLASTGARVVVVAGNHDNERRLQAVAPLLRIAGVDVQPMLARPGEGGCVHMTVRSGEPARIALVPFLSQRYVVHAADLMGSAADDHAASYDERVRRVVGSQCSGFDVDAVNIVLAHLFVANGVLGGGERSAHTILDYAVGAHAFPASATYVALGHLHRLQSLPAACPVWYSGSPLQLDFGEERDQKHVVLVDAAPGSPAVVRPVPLHAGRRLRTVHGNLEQLAAIATTAGDELLRVVVDEQRRAGLAEIVRELFHGDAEVVDVVVAVDASGSRRGREEVRPSRIGRGASDLFAEYLADVGVHDPAVIALFEELHDEVSYAS